MIVGKITSHIDVQKRPIEFLQMAKKTYTHMPDSEDTFRTFFKETAAKLPKQGEMAQKLIHVFNDCILDGGVMAIDMFAALCAESTGQAGKRELDESKLLVARLRTHHYEYHQYRSSGPCPMNI